MTDGLDGSEEVSRRVGALDLGDLEALAVLKSLFPGVEPRLPVVVAYASQSRAVGVTSVVIAGSLYRGDALGQGLKALMWCGDACDVGLVMLACCCLDEIVNVLESRVLSVPLRVLDRVGAL